MVTCLYPGLYCDFVPLFIVFVEADCCDKCGAWVVHERLFFHVVERAEHHIGQVRYSPRWMWPMPLQHPSSPEVKHLLEDDIFIDMALPFGLCLSPIHGCGWRFGLDSSAIGPDLVDTTYQWFPHSRQPGIRRVQVQPAGDNGNVWAVGRYPESGQAGRPDNISDVLGNHTRHCTHGDPAAHGITGCPETGNSDLMRQAGMQEAGVSVPDLGTIACMQGSAGWANFLGNDDRLIH